MRIRVNGIEEELPGACTLAELLTRRGTDPRFVAVARNAVCVRRGELSSTTIEPGDRIEIVSPMQGG